MVLDECVRVEIANSLRAEAVYGAPTATMFSSMASDFCAPFRPVPPYLLFLSPSPEAVCPASKDAIGYAKPTALSFCVQVMTIGPEIACFSTILRKNPSLP